MVMAGHCEEMPGHDNSAPGKAIDCMIACAAMASSEAPFLVVPVPMPAEHAALPFFSSAGIQPEAEPPPPRT